MEPKTFDGIKIGAYSWGNNTVLAGDYIPMDMAIKLAHEGGHTVANEKKFERVKILHPSDIKTVSIGLSEARKRWLKELLCSKETTDRSWHPELIEVIWHLLGIVTKNKFKPDSINLVIMPSTAEFKEDAKTRDFEGIDFNGDQTIAVPTKRGYSLEVPAYYTQRAIEMMINRAITPAKCPSFTPGLPSHKLALDAVERWYKRDEFPTPKLIHKSWPYK